MRELGVQYEAFWEKFTKYLGRTSWLHIKSSELYHEGLFWVYFELKQF